VIGTDQPIPWNEDPIGHVMETPLSNRNKAKILGLTAAKLLGIKTV
jgi:aminocarboxymuconate-semialdehyde decarboxylase